jgi:multisubunit Na+/H+ antiporter MnhG subunit
VQVGKKGKVVHIAHSQGALVTYLAAKQLTPLEMSQIEILAFGGAAAIRKTPQTPFARVVNYYAVNDPLLLVVPQAAQALRSGFVGEDSEFCFLAPRIGDPIRDHNLFGPTYAQALAWEGQRFQSQYQSLAHRSTRFVCLILIALFRALYNRVYSVCKIVMQKTLLLALPIFLYVWEKSEVLRAVIKAVLIKPLVTTLVVLYLLVRELQHSMRLHEADQYQPAQIAIDLAQEQVSTS